MRKRKVLFFFLLVISLFRLMAQTTPSDPSMTSTQFDMKNSPQWAKDLRRAEIVAFGSFPFMYLFSNIGVDTYRFFREGRDFAYAPWPLTSAGGAEKEPWEKGLTLGIAAGGAILIAVIDYSIELHKRNKKQKEIMSLPEGTPIIIRTPLFKEETEVSEYDGEYDDKYDNETNQPEAVLLDQPSFPGTP